VALLVVLVAVMMIGVSAYGAQLVIQGDDGKQGDSDRCPPPGTSLTVNKTATGFYEQRVSYDWTIQKSVDPGALELIQGDSDDVAVQIDVTRGEGTTETVIGVRGTITVTSTGEHPTENLQIVDTVERHLNGNDWEVLYSTEVDLGDDDVIDPHETVEYDYEIIFTNDDVSPGDCLRNVVYVIITNHPDDYGNEWYPGPPKTDFCIPSEPTIVEAVDEEATVTDSVAWDPELSVSVDDPGPWYFTDSGTVTYTMTITNMYGVEGEIFWVNNTACVTANDTSDWSEDDASVAVVSLGMPDGVAELTVTKTADVTKSAIGHTIIWNISVCNTGEVPLYTVWINDTDLGIGYNEQHDILVGQCVNLTFEYVVDADDIVDDLVKNTVYVEAYHETVHLTYEVSKTVFIAQPSLTVTKVAQCPDTGEEIEEIGLGHDIVWNITVCNTGNVALDNVWVNDSFMEFSEQISLAKGECRYFELEYTVEVGDLDDNDEICNTVEVDYFYCHWFYESDCARVFVAMPGISVNKVALCPDTREPIQEIGIGHDIVWNITVCNTGNVPLEDIWVNDTMLGFTTQISLGVGECWSVELGYTTSMDNMDDNDLICNSVTAEVFYCHVWYNDSANACVFVAMPDLEVTKSANVDATGVGQTIIWNITVCNTGNVPLDDIRVFDPMLGIDTIISLDVGECAYFEEEYIVLAEDVADDKVCNWVYVEAPYCHIWIDDEASACVTIGDVCIAIEKIGPCRAMAGEEIPFKIFVHNPSGVTLTDIEVYDQLLNLTYSIESLAPDEWDNRTFWYIIPEDYQSEYVVNVVEVDAWYDGMHLWCIDSHAVDIIHPCIDIVKTGPDYAMCGEEITYTINVTNCGDVDLENVYVTDPLFGEDWNYTIGYLPEGASVEFTVNYVIPADYVSQNGRYLNNTATAFGEPGPSEYWCCGYCDWFDDSGYDRWVNDSDDHSVFIFCNVQELPCVEVNKTARCAYTLEEIYEIRPGHPVFWNISVTNCGVVDLSVWVNDSFLGMSVQVFVPANSTVYLDEPEQYYIVNEADMNNDYLICNFVEAEAWWMDIYTYDNDTACIFVAMPSLEVTKTALCGYTMDPVEEVYPGHPVVWNITVYNSGNVNLSQVWVNDTFLVFNQMISLDVGEYAYFELVYTVDVGDADDDIICNLVEVEYFYCHAWFDESAEDCVFVAMPDVCVTKTALCGYTMEPVEEVYPGHPIVWNITVCNTGNVPLENVWVNDTFLNFSEQISLDVDEYAYFELEYSVNPSDANREDMICNSVVVDYFYHHVWFDESAEDCVFVVMPDVEVTKTALCGYDKEPIDEVFKGHPVVWNITVHNIGNVPLENVWVNDTFLNFSEQISLDVGEYAYFELNYTVDAADRNQDDMICNSVVVDYFYHHVWFNDTASDCVFVAMPDICVEKTALCGYSDEEIYEVYAGHPIVWNITVCNTGNVPLENVWVNDTFLNFSEQISLDVGEYAYFELNYTACVEDMDNEYIICNEVVVDFFYHHVWFTKNATDCIFIAMPDIEVTKTAFCAYSAEEIEEVYLGHPVVWNITVCNNGNVPLENVWVNDTFLNFSEQISLDVGECRYFELEYTTCEQDMNENDFICNTVNVDYFYCHVWFSENATDCIFIAIPELQVEKSGCECVCWNHTVYYNISVYNSGNVVLENVSVVDPLTGLNTTIESIAPGEYFNTTTSYFVPMGWCDSDFVNNTVYVNWTYCHYQFSTSDDWTTFVAKPKVNIDKTGPEGAVAGETITYYLNVSNAGNVPLADIHVWDGLLGLDTYIGCLGVGEWEIIVVNYTVPECIDTCGDCDSLTNIAYAEAWYSCCNCECYTMDYDCWEIDILDLNISILKTGPEWATPGETITFTFNVTNNGEVPLTDVYVTDPLLGEDWTYWIGDLDVGESVVFTADYTIPSCFTGDKICNFAYAFGSYHGIETMWGDGWAVWIYHSPCDSDTPLFSITAKD